MSDHDPSQDHTSTPSRGARQSPISWDRRLCEQGKPREPVLREIYGVHFPPPTNAKGWCLLTFYAGT